MLVWIVRARGKFSFTTASLLPHHVERAHPDLTGGVGIYKATSAHGPFVHIDVRGTKARWGSL